VAIAEVKNANDQKKLIIAGALGLLLILALWWMFFGFGGSSKPNPGSAVVKASPSPSPVSGRTQQAQKPDQNIDLSELTPIDYHSAPPVLSDGGRNIFAYYVPPPPPPSPLPSPSPTPTPPMMVTFISPSSVFARTDDFRLDVGGDKFTPAAHINIDGRDLPSSYVNPQQLSTTVPASMIANPGQRQISVRTGDGKLYSNSVTLTVNAPPVPNYNYVGLIGKPRRIGDTAILQDKSSKEILTVQRGDTLPGGRFRVTSISEREIVLVDTVLKIKAPPLPMTNEDGKTFPPGRPTPRVQSEDDEP
jgi:hypothetical protein